MNRSALIAVSAGALAVFAVAAPIAAHAQVADCDLGSGAVDLFVHLRFEKFDNCGGATGVACTQDADEQDLVSWGVALDAGPGTSGDSGTTNVDGDATWSGNGLRLNTCVGYGTHTVTFTVPSPSPYHANASWPVDLSFDFTINPTNAQTGQPVERYFLGVSLGCSCAGDGRYCTLDTCLNGDCPYALRSYDPTRAEVCNQTDDDCDGEVDEGLPPTAPSCNLASAIGCADKTREGFMSWQDYPLIAACGGAWSAGSGEDGDGLFGDPSCARAAGNHGSKAVGTGCHAADLCAAGWHVCYGPADVAQRLGAGGCEDAVDAWYPNFGSGPIDEVDVSVPPGGAFFATRAQAGACTEGASGPADGGLGAVYGCGNMGAAVGSGLCGDVLDRQSGGSCGGLRGTELTSADDPATDYGYAQSGEWAWSCGAAAQTDLSKTMPDRQGGVLCCKDTDPSLAEVCDGLDNDGDGATDETVFGADGALAAGATCHVGALCGTLACAPDGTFVCEGPHACADTTCDGVDDDHDGDTDDDYVAPVTHCGIGACAATGLGTCVDGDVVDTCAAAPKAEAQDLTCDSQDGDCDGSTDEDFVAADTTCGVGACARSGHRTCVEGTPGDTCVAGTPAASDATCDGIDDDCDGTDDDGYVGTATTCGVGACARTGTSACVDGVEGDGCTPGTPAEASDLTCDGADGDCDGDTDEDFVAAETTCGVGRCAGNHGVATCAGGAPGDTCDPLAGAVTETCNGEDDDCDGEADDGFGVGTACDGADADQCANGQIACDGAGAATCVESGEDHVETCNGADDDCDGETDEGLAASGCTDRDEDGVPDPIDNCVDIANSDQEDVDGDHVGDACDLLGQGGACAGGPPTDLGLGLALGLALVWRVRERRARLPRG